MKILLAGPGTGKTTRIKDLIAQWDNAKQCLVLSFTNATVNDLLKNLSGEGVSQDNCMTLHKFAIKYNHDNSRHILLPNEIAILEQTAKQTGQDFLNLCNQLSATTFDQMISRFVEFASANELYLRQKLSGFKYLIVDEYQDFNPNEQALIDLLVSNFEEIIILGDDDQCIYDFKDASSKKIIEFYNDITVGRIDHEHKCHRCPDEVVEHATNLIKNNKNRIDKQWHKSGKKGNLIYLQQQSLDDAADYVLHNVKRIASHDPEAAILILAPVKFAIDPIAEKLTAEGIDFENKNKPQIDSELVEKSWEIKACFGSFKYLNLLFLGYKKMAQRKRLYDTLKLQLATGLNFEDLFNTVSNKLPAEVLAQHSDAVQMMSLGKYERVKKLFDEVAEGTTDEKLEKIFHNREEDAGKKIKLMSIHKSKGLGSEYVFVVGLTEGILPNKKAGSDSIEAQRRLFYVGITRAKKCLCLISILKIPGKFVNKINKADFKYDYSNRLWNGKASRYISELKLKK